MSTRRLTTVSCDTPIEQVVEIIRRDGAVAICNFVSEETLKSLTEDLDSYLGVTPCGMDPYFAGTQTRRTARILAKSDSAVEVALNPLFLETAKQVLQTPTHVWVGNDRVEITPDIQLSMTQAIQIGPGQGLQPCIATMPLRSGGIRSMVARLACSSCWRLPTSPKRTARRGSFLAVINGMTNGCPPRKKPSAQK